VQREHDRGLDQVGLHGRQVLLSKSSGIGRSLQRVDPTLQLQEPDELHIPLTTETQEARQGARQRDEVPAVRRSQHDASEAGVDQATKLLPDDGDQNLWG
jgi:hypothetical protein